MPRKRLERTPFRILAVLTAMLVVAQPLKAQCSASVAAAAAGGRTTQGRAALQKSVGTAWTDSSYHCMGTLFERELRWADAREWYEKAIAANPRNAFHHQSLGNALSASAATASMFEQMSLGKKMLAEYDLALSIDSTLIDARSALAQIYAVAPALMGGSVEKAEAQAAAIARLNPMRGHMTRGIVLLAGRKDSAGAEQEYLAAIASAPDSVAARYRLAAFYRAKKDWPKAFAVYDSVRRRSPNDELLPYGFGLTAAASGQQLDRGERDLRAWIAKPSVEATYAQIASAHYSLGLIAEKKTRSAEAKKEYEAALRFNPDHKDAKLALERLK